MSKKVVFTIPQDWFPGMYFKGGRGMLVKGKSAKNEKKQYLVEVPREKKEGDTFEMEPSEFETIENELAARAILRGTERDKSVFLHQTERGRLLKQRLEKAETDVKSTKAKAKAADVLTGVGATATVVAGASAVDAALVTGAVAALAIPVVGAVMGVTVVLGVFAWSMRKYLKKQRLKVAEEDRRAVQMMPESMQELSTPWSGGAPLSPEKRLEYILGGGKSSNNNNNLAKLSGSSLRTELQKMDKDKPKYTLKDIFGLLNSHMDGDGRTTSHSNIFVPIQSYIDFFLFGENYLNMKELQNVEKNTCLYFFIHNEMKIAQIARLGEKNNCGGQQNTSQQQQQCKNTLRSMGFSPAQFSDYQTLVGKVMKVFNKESNQLDVEGLFDNLNKEDKLIGGKRRRTKKRKYKRSKKRKSRRAKKRKSRRVKKRKSKRTKKRKSRRK